jgi:hypothetical protein
MGEMRKAHEVLEGNSKRKRLVERIILKQILQT